MSREAINDQIRAEMIRLKELSNKKEQQTRALLSQIQELEQSVAPTGARVKVSVEAVKTFPLVVLIMWMPIGIIFGIFFQGLGWFGLVIVLVGFLAVWVVMSINQKDQEWRTEKSTPVKVRVDDVRAQVGRLRAEYDRLRRDLKRPYISDKLRKHIWIRDEKTCYLCGNEIPHWGGQSMHIDHMKAFSTGGTNNQMNLRATHPKCNLEKGAGSLEIG